MLDGYVVTVTRSDDMIKIEKTKKRKENEVGRSFANNTS